MALVSLPLLGRASGKFSESEFYRLKNKNVLRSAKLKRYKKASNLVSYNQLLLKAVVSLFLPIKDLLKSIYNKNRLSLNYFNYLIKRNYSNFYLDGNNDIACIDETAFILNNSSDIIKVSAEIIDYDANSLSFKVVIPPPFNSLFNPDFVICFSYNSLYSTFFDITLIDSVESIYRYTYSEPPFNSLDYNVYLVLKRGGDAYFALPVYIFTFQHG